MQEALKEIMSQDRIIHILFYEQSVCVEGVQK